MPTKTIGVPAVLATILATVLIGMVCAAAPARADSLDPPVQALPAAESNVKANPVFTWAPVSRAARYRIEVSTTSAFASITWAAEVYGTSATPTAELPLGTLHWRVATLDHTRVVGAFSPSRSLTKSPADAPELVAPANGTRLAYPGDPAVLSWKPVAGIKQYRVELDDESTFIGAAAYTTAGTALALPTALPSNAPRFWRVQGVSTNSAVATAWSDATDLRSFSIAWPAGTAPMLLSPADSLTIDVDEIAFSWSPVPGAADYEVQINTSRDFTGVGITQVTDATRLRPTNTLAQDQYFWRVRARQPNADPTAWSAVRGFKREWLDAGGQPARLTPILIDAEPIAPGMQLEQGRISVAWTSVRRAAYYEIEVSASPTFPMPGTSNCKTPHTEWTPYIDGTYTGTASFGLCRFSGTLGTTYHVRVRAVDRTPSGALITTLWSNTAREGEGVAPDPVTFTLKSSADPTTAAGEPAELLPTPDSVDTPKLAWKPVTGATSYRVGLARDSSFNTRVLTGPAGPYVTTTNTELLLNQSLLDNTAGEPYFWFVLPCNSTGCVGENQAINIPGKFASFNKLGRAVEGLTGESVQTDTVALAWQDQLATSPDGGGTRAYELEVRNAADVVVDSVVTDAVGYTPIRKTYADGLYTWRVRALDGSGTPLAWSVSPSFEKRSSVPAPEPPAASDTLPVLRWQPTSFAASYDVEVYRGVDPAFPAGNKVPAAGSTTGRPYPIFAPTVALRADTYSWRVRQVDIAGKAGPWSTQVRPFTVGGRKPVLQSPAADGTVPVTSLMFRWSEVPGAVRYRLESSSTPGFGTLTDDVDTTATSFAPTAAHAGATLYYWRVSALNANDDTMATSDPIAFTAQTAPAAPTASAAVSGATISVSWTTPPSGGSALTGYVTRYRAVGTTAWTDLERGADVASVALGALLPNQRYEAQVAAQNAVGVGPFSSLVSATTPTVPAVPTALQLTPGAGGFSVAWTAPSATGGSPITGYVVRVAGNVASETTVTGLTAVLSGLADGTTYTVEVAARNAVGRGPFASAEGTTRPAAVTFTPSPTATTVSPAPGGNSFSPASPAPAPAPAATAPGAAAVRPAPVVLQLARAQTVGFGRPATLTGTLTSSTGAPIETTAMTIESLPAKTTAWRRVIAVSTTLEGTFSSTVRPTVNTQYRAVFAGASPNLAGTSSPVSVRVGPNITVKSSAKSARRGSTVVFSGRVLPTAAGRKVALQCLAAKKWVTRTSGKTSEKGTYRLRLKLTSSRGLTCRVASPASATMATGLSRRVVVKIS